MSHRARWAPDQGRYRSRLTPVLGAAGALVLLVTGAATAETLYWWQDERGVTHITDEPPPEGIDYETRQARSAAEKTSQTSEAVRQRRCRDFRGALTQLRNAEDLPADKSGWRAAKKRAKRKIDQWCQTP